MEQLKCPVIDSSDDLSQDDTEPDDDITDCDHKVEKTTEKLKQYDIELGNDITRAHEHVTQYTFLSKQYETVEESKLVHNANLPQSKYGCTFTADLFTWHACFKLVDF